MTYPSGEVQAAPGQLTLFSLPPNPPVVSPPTHLTHAAKVLRKHGYTVHLGNGVHRVTAPRPSGWPADMADVVQEWTDDMLTGMATYLGGKS